MSIKIAPGASEQSNAPGAQTGNSATPTVASQAIATIPTPPAGDYLATVLAYVSGTTGAADADNMQLSWNGGSQVITALMVPLTGQPTLNGPFTITGVNGINSVIVRSGPATPSGTAIYH